MAESNDGLAAAASESDAPDGQAASAGWTNQQPYDYSFAESQHEWEGNSRVYEWDGEMGAVGPEFPELELELFGPNSTNARHGIDFSKITTIEVFQEGPVRIDPIGLDFKDAGLHPVMQRNIELSGYKVPTPIQRFAIPAISQGYDLISVAQTGSGKTAAYLIPIIGKLMGKAKKWAAPRPNPATYRPGIDPPVRAEPLVVILVPTRELCVQIFNETRKFCYRTMLRPCCVYGGGPLSHQIEQLQKGCDIIVATPGRLIDFIDRPHILTLRRLKYFVIDEADEMLDADWEDDFKKLLTGGDQDEGNVKYMLFSATFPKPARDLAKNYLAENHVRIRVGRAGSSHANIKQQVIWCEPFMKRQCLTDLLRSMQPCRTLVFVRSKQVADELDDFLFNLGFPCTSLHADRTQYEREAAMRAFRSGKSPIMIATGVAARGLDVVQVLHVINYDLPSYEHGGIEEYTHRIGRTGRIGHRGVATSLYTEKDEPMASVLTRTLMETGQEIPDFLQAYVPEGEAGQKLKFEADSDFDEDDVAGAGDAGGGAWGASATGNDAAGADAQGADADASPWGTSAHVTPQAAAEKDEATSGW